MGAEPTVQVRLASVRRAWESSGANEAWLLLRDSTAAFDEFVDAQREANGLSQDRSSLLGTMPSTTPQGHVVCLSGITAPDALEFWVDAFRQGLERRGVSGTLGPARAAAPPAFLSSSLPSVLSVFVAWTVDLEALEADPSRNRHWHVAAPATERICSLASSWATMLGRQVLLRQNTFVVALDCDDVTEPLRRSVQLTGMAGVDVVDEEAQSARHVALAPGGEGVFQVIDDRLGWEPRVERLRAAVVGVPGDTNHAFVRSAHRGALGITEVDTVVPLPGIREYHVRYNKHLHDEYVPDAHGIQVLTEAHVRRANDLSRWSVSPLESGRYLVEAPDLDRWYADATPDGQVLAQARKDFGPMLLTEEVIRNHPAPRR